MLTDTQDTDLVRMSHAADPDTSRDAAVKASRGEKKKLIQEAIVRILETGPATGREIHREYWMRRKTWELPSADVYDIRRRLSELKNDAPHRVVDTGDRRHGEAVMALKAGA